MVGCAIAAALAGWRYWHRAVDHKESGAPPHHTGADVRYAQDVCGAGEGAERIGCVSSVRIARRRCSHIFETIITDSSTHE